MQSFLFQRIREIIDSDIERKGEGMGIKLRGSLAALMAAVVFWSACGSQEPQQQVQQTPVYDANTGTTALVDDYWAKDNFDLQRVGDLLERSDSPEEFERYLNEPGGINNLDLNGDGYVDYVSVREFDDRDQYERGLSLYSQFGPSLIQEIASVIFYRDEPRYPGARILLRGDERLYGDNVYYETNWLDRTLQIASFLFSDRNDFYRSPYYYDNYPSWYETYEVVETPVYRTRVVELYPQPLFVYTTSPTFVEKVKIKSPNNGLHLGQIKAKLVKPTKEQEDFIKNNPRTVKAVKVDKGPRPADLKRGNDKPGKGDDPSRLGPPQQAEAPKGGPPAKPAQAEKPKGGNPGGKPDKPGKGPGGGNPGGKGKKP
jgi:hypothetical protein